MQQAAAEAQGLVKTYTGRTGTVEAVRGVDLRVEAGEIFGFLGPNGAGKSTTVRMLTTLLSITSGRARVAGHDVADEPDAVRRRIGVALQEAGLDARQTGRELLELQGRLFDLSAHKASERAVDLLELVELTDAADRSIKGYSGGMRRRLDLAASLVQRPAVLFLDEPTTGLDPRSRGEVWAMIRALVAEGTTVLLTTQYLDEADRLANQIAVIDHGRVIATGTAAELKAKIGQQTLDVRPADPADLTRAAAIVAAAVGRDPVRTDEDPGLLSVPVDDAQALPAVISGLAAERIEVTELALRLASLDEVFMALTGHAAEENPQ